MREIELRLRGTDMCLNESPSEKEGKFEQPPSRKKPFR